MANHETQTIRVLRLPCEGQPRLETIQHTLANLQKSVGGNIEQFPVELVGAIGLCDDEFLYHGQPVNLAASALRSPGVAPLRGDVIIVGDALDQFGSISQGALDRAQVMLIFKLGISIPSE